MVSPLVEDPTPAPDPSADRMLSNFMPQRQRGDRRERQCSSMSHEPCESAMSHEPCESALVNEEGQAASEHEERPNEEPRPRAHFRYATAPCCRSGANVPRAAAVDERDV